MNKLILKKKILPTFLLLIITLVNSSCVELGAIRKFTENAAAVSETFPALSSDFYDSCVRGYRYLFTQKVKFRPDLTQEIKKLSNVENLDGYRTEIPRDASGSIVQHEVKCRNWKKSDKAALLLNKVLVDYMKSLGELAADDLTSYDTNLNALSTNIAATDIFEQKHIDAGKGLASFILNAATNFWRRKKLKSAIENRDKDVSTLAVVLKTYITKNYVERLENEKKRMDDFYTETILEHQEQGRNTNQLTVLMIQNDWDARQKQIKDKIDSANAYGKILDKVIAGHHKLYEFRESLNSKEVRQIAVQYAKEIESLIPILRKAFKS